MHENGVLDGHDALLALDRRSQPLGHAEQPEVGHAIVEAELSRDPRRYLRVRVRRILPAVFLRVEGESGRGEVEGEVEGGEAAEDVGEAEAEAEAVAAAVATQKKGGVLSKKQ